ncbi:MAG: 1-(5-phosphoribosyl)-5-[(5-phosphoribosylamino)methylideneamino]imidazole-4-carboxamide isomerase [Clostridiales bacterium]|nr:1-(5-phosphoribosyl)-5-[(5-phosphoribosylamino)methylideneamino]imidazole-4-carboxamide isomerase [Clostridiales bacterium]
MIILPAIDLLGGRAVRLLRGDYEQVTVYDDDPLRTARRFAQAGAEWLHVVDLDGARSGGTDNLPTVCRLAAESGLKVELGGGVRSMETIERYLNAGVQRVILGTAAAVQPGFAREAAARFGAHIAAGVDLRDGRVSVRGWTETTALEGEAFCRALEQDGVQTVVCTDISRDGAMQGTNRALYGRLSSQLSLRLIASGGVSSLEDVRALAKLGLYGAIIGKAYYTGALTIEDAIAAAGEEAAT